MKVQILKQLSNCNVLCKTDYGEVTLCWTEETIDLDEIYFVEFSTDEILVKGENIFITNEDFALYNDKNKVILIGDLTFIYDDECAVIEIENSIILMKSHKIKEYLNKRVKVILNKLDAYPYYL